MRHLWIAGSVEAAYLLLDKAIGLGDALMLAQMLHPAFDEKGLDDAALLRGIFKHAPGIGAVAAPPMLEALSVAKAPIQEAPAIALAASAAIGSRARP